MLSLDAIYEFGDRLTRLWDAYDENAEHEMEICVFDKYALKIVDKLPVLHNMLEIENERCILVYASNADTCVPFVSDVRPIKEAESTALPSEELDLTGHPLECPFNLEDSVFDQTKTVIDGSLHEQIDQLMSGYRLLNSSATSGIVSLFRETSKHIKQSKNIKKWSVAPFVVLCDGEDHENTVVMGLQRTVSGSKHFRIRCKGCAFPIHQLPDFDNWKSVHLLGISHNLVDTAAKAEFAILEMLVDDAAKNDAQSSIMLECEWKNVHQLLEAPNTNAICTIHFNVILGDSRSAVSSKLKELKILEDLMQCLNTKYETWASALTADVSVLKEVTQLIDEMTLDRNRKRVTDRSKGKTLETNLIDKLLKDGRKNLDFTDKLWTVLKSCGSRSELCSCLNLALQKVQSGEIKPVIFSMNTTSLGMIITDIHRRKAKIPNLDLVNVLQLLVEIGVEKLKQDYISIFLMSGLVSKENINPIIRNITETSEKSLSSLWKLHCILELIALCKTYVNPPDGLLSTYTRVALSQLSSVPFNSKSCLFSFQIDRQNVHEVVLRNAPKKWHVLLKSRQDAYEVRTAIFLSTEHPLRTGSVQQAHSELNSEDGLPYYCCTSTTVQDSF